MIRILFFTLLCLQLHAQTADTTSTHPVYIPDKEYNYITMDNDESTYYVYKDIVRHGSYVSCWVLTVPGFSTSKKYNSMVDSISNGLVAYSLQNVEFDIHMNTFSIRSLIIYSSNGTVLYNQSFDATHTLLVPQTAFYSIMNKLKNYDSRKNKNTVGRTKNYKNSVGRIARY